MECTQCEMCNETIMKKESKNNPESLIPFTTEEDPVIHVEQTWKGHKYYVWTKGYKCLYNGVESLNMSDLAKGRCRLRGGK